MDELDGATELLLGTTLEELGGADELLLGTMTTLDELDGTDELLRIQDGTTVPPIAAQISEETDVQTSENTQKTGTDGILELLLGTMATLEETGGGSTELLLGTMATLDELGGTDELLTGQNETCRPPI